MFVDAARNHSISRRHPPVPPALLPPSLLHCSEYPVGTPHSLIRPPSPSLRASPPPTLLQLYLPPSLLPPLSHCPHVSPAAILFSSWHPPLLIPPLNISCRPLLLQEGAESCTFLENIIHHPAFSLVARVSGW